MPCFCKQKVDRAKPKVQCAKCKEFYHLPCVGLKPADVDYLNSSNQPFSCKVCLAERRASIRSLPSSVTSDNFVVESANSRNNINNENKEKSDKSANVDLLTLNTLVNEISSLRAENAKLMSLVGVLHDDRMKLIEESSALHAEFRLMQSKVCDQNASLSTLTGEIKQLRCTVDGFVKLSNYRADVYNSKQLIDLPNQSLSHLASSSLAIGCTGNFSAPTAPNASAAVTKSTNASMMPSTVSAPPSSLPVTLRADNTEIPDSADKRTAASYAARFSSVTNAATASITPSISSTPELSLPVSSRADNTAISISGDKRTAIRIAAGSPSLTSTIDATETVATSLGNVNAPIFSSLTQSAAFAPAAGNPELISVTPNIQPNTGWINVEKRKTRKNLRVVGLSSNTDLQVVYHKKWLHLSSFLPSVSADNIIDYVVKYAGVDRKNLLCYALIKQQSPPVTPKKVNFKLGVSNAFYHKLLSPDLWPANVNIRPFRFLEKKEGQEMTAQVDQKL